MKMNKETRPLLNTDFFLDKQVFSSELSEIEKAEQQARKDLENESLRWVSFSLRKALNS
jgi:hypothetical protein